MSTTCDLQQMLSEILKRRPKLRRPLYRKMPATTHNFGNHATGYAERSVQSVLPLPTALSSTRGMSNQREKWCSVFELYAKITIFEENRRKNYEFSLGGVFHDMSRMGRRTKITAVLGWCELIHFFEDKRDKRYLFFVLSDLHVCTFHLRITSPFTTLNFVSLNSQSWTHELCTIFVHFEPLS